SHTRAELNEVEETVKTVPTTGDFIHDALSDVDGNIRVGEDMYVRGAFLDFGECEYFGAGPWQACFRAKHRRSVFPFVVRNLSTQIREFERNGRTTRTVCDKFLGFLWNINCETRRIKADAMGIANQYVVNTPYSGHRWGLQHDNSVNDTDFMELGRNNYFLGGVCGLSAIDDSGHQEISPEVVKPLSGFHPNNDCDF
ncbi:MAG: hypothetical protein ACQEVA_22235, partial [Myxococcota bacterium]